MSGKKDRTLKEKSFVMDINMIEVPLCQFSNTRTITTAKSLRESDKISDSAKHILDSMQKEVMNSQVEFLSWTDSNGVDREILATSILRLPNPFAMEVFHALVGLFVKKNSPISFDEENKVYNMPVNKLEFKIAELCDFMKLQKNGPAYSRIKDAIMQLHAVNYYSLANGTFYDKKNESYYVSRKKSISLISDFDFFEKEERERRKLAGHKAKKRKDEKCEVVFGNLVMENLRYSYIKFLNNELYFTIPSGITRRLYSYIEGNRYNRTYIKRSFDVLRYKIPISFNYPSELKRKINNPLNNLVKHGIVKDFIYGDEIFINDVKEECIYIILKGTRQDLIKSLTKEKKAIPIKAESIKTDNELVFPENIEEELIKLGINSKKIVEIMNVYSKYKIAEYLLWIKDGIKKGKAENPAALFIFAITGNMVKVGRTHPHIEEFINKYRQECEGKNEKILENAKKEYDKYIQREIKNFIEKDEFAYNILKLNILDEMNDLYAEKVKKLKSLYNMAEKERDKNSTLENIEKWEDFKIKQESSNLYKEMLEKQIRIYKGLKMFEDFKNEYINKNI